MSKFNDECEEHGWATSEDYADLDDHDRRWCGPCPWCRIKKLEEKIVEMALNYTPLPQPPEGEE